MIHIYPAMGTTSAMYGSQWKKEIHGVFHDWPQWKGEATIGELAERILVEHSIEDGDVLIGSSLGGMVAGEIARKRRLELVVLIGSAVSPGEIRKSLGNLHPLIDLLPLSFVRACSGRLPSDLAKMFYESEPEFVRAMIKAIFKWEGVDPSTRLLRIHGTRDLVIPPPKEVDLLVRGGHFIAMTHAGTCIQKIKAERITGEHGADGPDLS